MQKRNNNCALNNTQTVYKSPPVTENIEGEILQSDIEEGEIFPSCDDDDDDDIGVPILDYQ